MKPPTLSIHALTRFVPVLALAACATPSPPLPAALAAQPDATHVLTTGARGVQIYECRAAAGPQGRFEWSFVAPRADLLDPSGRVIGHHGAGPYWQALDGSRIVGRVSARSDAPQGASSAIPWLLLQAQRDGEARAGVLAGVRQVQRLNTDGGVAPAGGCDGAHAGQRIEVPYRADYHFYL